MLRKCTLSDFDLVPVDSFRGVVGTHHTNLQIHERGLSALPVQRPVLCGGTINKLLQIHLGEPAEDCGALYVVGCGVNSYVDGIGDLEVADVEKDPVCGCRVVVIRGDCGSFSHHADQQTVLHGKRDHAL